MSIGIGSIGKSATPILLCIDSISSGKFVITIFSIRVAVLVTSVRDVPGFKIA